MNIRGEINRKSRHFDLPLEDESEDLLDAYYRKVSSSNTFQSDETDVRVISRMKESIRDAKDRDGFSAELRSLLGFITSKLS